MRKQLLILLLVWLGSFYTAFAQVPTITDFTPKSGPIGTAVTITGTNFSPTAANNIVYFGAVRATVTAATSTSLTVTVPVGATYAPISATVNGLTAYSIAPFVVTFPSSGGIDASSFASRVNFATGATPYVVRIGDLDGDGKPDIAVSNIDGNTISILRNTGVAGTVSFAPKVDFATGIQPFGLAIGDLDGDGKPDIAVANYGSNTISIFRNTGMAGTVSFASKVDFATGVNPEVVAIGDLDGDGKPDIAVSNFGSNTVSILRNTGVVGTVSFASRVDFATGIFPFGVAIGDLDGDGKPDIAVANVGSTTVSILRNTGVAGTVSFASKVDFATGTNPYGVAIGDLNGDGKPDIALSNEGSNTVSIFRNTGVAGTVSFAVKVDFATGSGPWGVAIGDLDGDGKPDIAVSNQNSSTVSLFRNTEAAGTVSFAPKVDFATAGFPLGVAIGDLDGDGKPDITTANGGGSPTVSVLRNITAPPPPAPTISSFSPTFGPIGTSVTITGTNFSPTAANNIVYFGAVRATVTAATSTSLTVTVPTGATYAPITVTVNGLTGYSRQPFIVTFAGGGAITNSSFSAKVDFTTGTGPNGVAIGDLDGDGKPDLAVTNGGSNTVSVFRNTSTSGEITIGSLAAKADFVTAAARVAIGDVDSDGKLDLVVTNGNGRAVVSVFRNTSTSGNISFAARLDFGTGGSPYGLAIGDLDGDGKPDIVTANNSQNTVSVLQNTSTSSSISFSAKVDFATGTSPIEVAICDMDGDTKPDVVVTNEASGTVSIFRNTSTRGSITAGSFAARVDFQSGSNPLGIAVGDMDGDSKLDVLVVNNLSNTVSVFRNISSSGSISLATRVDFATVGSNPRHIAIADIDGDGKPDFAVTNGSRGTVSVFRNTSTIGSITIGSFAPKVDFATGTGPAGVVIGDIDSDGKPDVVVTNNNSNTVSVFRNTVTPPVPTTISLTSGNNQSGQISTALTNPFVVTVTDAGGNPVSGTSVTFAIASVPSGATGQSLSTTNATTNSSGQASTILTLGNKVGTYTVTATSTGLSGSPVTFTATATPGPAVKVAFTTQPGNGTVGSPLSTQPVVAIQDAGGNTVTTSSANVTIAIGTNPSGGTLSGTTTVAAVNGVATFTNLTIDKVGNGYTLVASSLGLASATSNAFNVTVGPARNISLTSGNSQSGQINTALSNPFVVTVTDAGGNPVQGTSVTFAIASTPSGATGQSLSTTSTTTNSSGQASTILTLGNKVGTYTVTASSTGLAGSPVTFTASAFDVPTVATSSATNVGSTSATLNGSVNPNGLTTTAYFEWGTSSTLSSFSTTASQSIGSGTRDSSVTTSLTGLSPNTTYYYRVVGQNSAGISRGSIVSFTTMATAAAPTITSFSPTSGPIGTSVTITGTNFSPTAANNIVYFGAVRATVTAATSTSLTVTVPTGATYAPITVTVNGLTAYSRQPFIVTFAGGGTITNSSFSAKVDFPTGTNPYSVAIGDLDGDGKPDLAVTNWNSNTVSVFRNTSTSGSVSFAAKVDFTTGSNPRHVAIGDLDGNGKPDMVVANFGSNTVSVFRNTSTSGSITFTAKVDFTTGDNPRRVAIGDMDGDGKADIAVANNGSNTVSVFRNTSIRDSIDLAAKVDFTTGSGPNGVAIGDVDGDGKPDVAVTNDVSNTVSVFKNTSTSGLISLAAKVDFTTGFIPRGVAIGDVDGDGKPDVAVANVNNSTVSIFRNTSTSGSITLAAKVDFTTGSGPYGIAIADVDGDGKPDVAVSNYGGNTVSVLRNTSTNGLISFASKVDFTTGSTPRDVAIGDVDGDGKPDVAVTNYDGNIVSVFRNRVGHPDPPTITDFTPKSGPIGTSVTITGTNFSTTAANNIVYFGAVRATVSSATSTSLTVTVPTGATYSPITVTVNGLTAYSGAPFIVIFSGGGAITSSSFLPKVDFPTGLSPRNVVIGDLDRDGKVDLVVSNASSNTVSLFQNTSTTASITASSFAPKVDLPTGFQPRVALGDVDSDGMLDIVVTNIGSLTVSVFRNTSTDRNMTFAPGLAFYIGSSPTSIAIGDLDGDGKPDLAVTIYDRTLWVFRNLSASGSINFEPVNFTTGSDPWSVAIGDLDGDWKPDLAVANRNSNTISVFRNTSTSGSISFDSKVDFPTGSGPQGVAIGDLDGDGKPDLAVANSGSNTVSVLPNTSTSGSVSFAAKVDFPTGTFPYSVAIGDIDGDGKPDLAVANQGSNTVSVFRNTGTSGSVSFAAKVDFTTGSGPLGVAIGDVDGDGRPDLAVANEGSSTVSVFRNTVGEAPTTPTLSSPANGATNQPTTLTLSWSAVTGATRYRLQVSTSSAFTTTLLDDSTITTTSRQVGPLANNTTYYWRVAAGNASGWGEFSSPYSFTTTTLAAPTLSSPANGATNQPTTLTLMWSAVTGATRYRLQVATSSSFTATPLVVDDSSLTTVSRQVGPLANNTTYYWRVAAGNASGWSAFSSPYSFTTTLATPTLSSPANGATNQPTTLTLSWSAVTGATRYRLQVSTSSAFTTTVLDDSTITTTSRQVGPLANNTTYYWRVAAGNASGWSEFSSPYIFTTGLAAPALSSPANGATNQPTTLTLSWNAVSGATSYRLQVSTNQNFSPTIFDDSTITTTSRQVGPLAYNTNYYWRVSAKNTGGTGAYSAPWSFTTASGKLVTSPGISFPSDPTNSTDYRLVSFPGASSLRVGDLLSGNQNTDWRIFRETGSPPPNNLLELGSNSFFSIGEGYWLIKKGTFSFSRSVTMPQLSGDGTYTISVRNGWNIIGNPFDAAIPWSSIQSANGTSNRLWSYEGTSGFVSMSTLEPFRGYYFYSNQTTLKIPYPFPSLKHDSPPAPPIDWQLQLALRTAENEDRQNYVGISPAARETVDELDEPKPPVLSGQAALVFSRPEWNTRVRAFSSDFRPAVGEGQEWEFIVTHQKRGTGCITFSGVRDIPPEYDVVLINEQNTAPFDLRRSAEYSFQIVADTMRFRLVVGTKEYVQRRKAAFVPLEFDVSQNFPNPFNAYTMMKYQLPRPVRVQIDIFSVLGQRVKTLASGLHEAGFYTVVWDGTDDTRNAVASGVYFFRILVDDKPFRLLKAVLMK